MPSRVVVLVSGSGTNLQALMDDAGASFDIVAVVADRESIQGLERARAAGIPTAVVDPATFAHRDDWDAALAKQLTACHPDWIVCAGFMRILGPRVLSAFPLRIVNTHPALLPAFPGAHGVADALAYGVRVTGCTVHLVDAGVDTGPIIAQRAVDVRGADDVASLHERIKTEERALLVDVVKRLCVEGCTVDGRKVSIP